MKKSWTEKLNSPKPFQVKTLDKKFADMPVGCKMFIATPKIVDEYINAIPFGSTTDLQTLRNDLAIEYKADKTCPVTSGIFLRIVSEAAFESYKKGKNLEEITPFWRIVNPKMKVAKKLECGIEFIENQRKKEKINNQ